MKIATSPTLAGIEKMINKYFYSSTYKINPETLGITNSKGQVNTYKIEKKKGRYIFSMI